MLQNDIVTKNLVLHPMAVEIEVLGAWRVAENGAARGFVLAHKEENAVRLNFCLAGSCVPVWAEAVRALSDAVFWSFPCDFIGARIPLRDVELRNILLEEGYLAGEAFTQADLQGVPAAFLDMTLDRFAWYGMGTSRPFAEVHRIEGEILDLYCSYTMEASAEKGLVPAYCFEIAPHGQPQSIGRIDLRLGYTEKTYYGGNIGYGLQAEYRGRGYAAEACRMLVPLIQRHGMRRVVITCRTDNMPSRGTCEKLGARFVRQLELPRDTEMYERGDREICVYHWVIEK